MPNISMPNGDIVAFPDDMPREQIKGLIAQKFPDVAKQNSTPDTFDTVSDQALQGATFGVGNRAQAGLAALVASGINSKPFSENYKNAREVGTDKLNEEMQQRPALSIASNIAGGLATGGIGAETKAGTAIANSLRTGSTAARIGKGAIAGSLSGAAYGAGTAAYGKTGEGAERGAVSGALVGGAIPGFGAAANSALKGSKNVISGITARSPELLQDTADNLKDAAGGLYDQMRQVGATYTPKATQDLVSNLKSALSSNQFIPELNPKTTAIVNHIDDASKNGSLGLDDLDQYRRLLGKVAPTEDGVSAGKVKSAIDDFVNNTNASHLSNGNSNAINLLNQGRKQYAQASKFSDISDILSQAAGDPNKIKSGLQRFLNNPRNLRGYSDQEISALRDAASNTTAEKLLKMGGKFGIDLGTSLTPGNTIAPVVGAVASGTPITPIAGTLARQTQKYLARGKAENLLQTIEGVQNPSIPGKVVTPLLSAPAGGASGVINNIKNNITIPQQMPLPQNTPSSPPQSNAQPALFDRVMAQESGGKQFNTKGNPLVSTKGAVGISQIMPGTAYDAAKAAGLPYDPRRIYTDPEYNKALGTAYLGKMQQKYGDDTLALMAYNWGPGNVDSWLKRGGNPNQIPSETRNYVKRILGS